LRQLAQLSVKVEEARSLTKNFEKRLEGNSSNEDREVEVDRLIVPI
jgi:hypothetical protein